MQPRSSSAASHVDVTAYAGPPGSGESSGVSVGGIDAAAAAVATEHFGIPAHLEPLPYDSELDGPPWWLRGPGDPPLRRRYRRRPQDRLPKQAKHAPGP